MLRPGLGRSRLLRGPDDGGVRERAPILGTPKAGLRARGVQAARNRKNRTGHPLKPALSVDFKGEVWTSIVRAALTFVLPHTACGFGDMVPGKNTKLLSHIPCDKQVYVFDQNTLIPVIPLIPGTPCLVDSGETS
jgi:hypothetical protein